MSYVVRPLSEEEFQRQVLQLAHHRRWRVAHFRRVRIQRKDGTVYYETPVAADGRGFPDLLLVRGAVAIFAELKTDDGRVRPDQRKWLDALRLAGQAAYVWRPKDWPTIEEVLA